MIRLVILISTLLIYSCSSTKIASSWHDPNKQISIEKLNKVLVVAFLRTETNSRNAEDEMVSYLHGKGVASYNYLGKKFNPENENSIREKTREGGFDGAVTLRLINVDKEQVYQPGNFASYPVYYHSFSSYFFRSSPYASSPGYYETTKTYTFETNVYSLKENKIIWTGVTKSVNPDGVAKMTKEISKVVYKSMVKEGFIDARP